MVQPIYTKTGKGLTLQLVGILLIVFFGAIPVVLAMNEIELIKENDVANILISYGPFILGMCIGAFTISLGLQHSKTKILVYEDHIEGTGVVKGMASDFNLKYQKIDSITTNNGAIRITSGIMQYELNLSSEDAKKIAEFINSKI